MGTCAAFVIAESGDEIELLIGLALLVIGLIIGVMGVVGIGRWIGRLFRRGDEGREGERPD